jgi:hypothetical protein
LIWKQVEEFGELVVRFPGVLGGQNVGSEVVTEEI